MKNSLFRAALAVGALTSLTAGLSSCKDYLEVSPDSYYTAETAFSDVGGATSAVIGVYDMLSGDRIYGQTLSMFVPNDTDDLISSRSDGADLVAARRQIARYIVSPTNVETGYSWTSLYQGIERANICIDNIPRMASYGGADSVALHRLHGEALTLRAQFYFELVRNWGDVPAQFQPTVAGQDFNLPPAPRFATYQRLLDDLLLAERLLPYRSAAVTNNERITKGAAKALRARIALARAGYSANRENGSMERGPDPQRDYTIARDECRDLMARTGEHTLNPSFQDLFKSINEQRRDVANEIIFEVAMGGSGLHVDSKLGYYNGPRHYNSKTYGNSSGAIVIAPPFFYAFDSTDTRRDVSITPYSYGSSSTAANSAESDQQYGTTLIATTDGKFRRSWRATPLPGTINYLGYNWPLIRFADVVLMYAEAENEISGPTAEAVEALYKIRTRAIGTRDKATASLAKADLTSKDGFRAAIMNERLLEFSGEGIRKYDLLRWNKLSENLLAAKTRIVDLKNGTGSYNGNDFAKLPQKMYYKRVNGKVQWLYSFYKPSPATAPVDPTIFSVNWRQSITDTYVTNLQPGGGGLASEYMPGKGKELLPIPQATLDTDKALHQNFGY